MKKNIALSLIIGIALSVAAFYLALRNVPLQELYHYFFSVNYIWVLPALGMLVSAFLLRALRWQLILQSSANIGFWRAFHPMMIGFMVNCILPGRLGELTRPVILQTKEKVPFSTGLATVVTERVFDTLMLIVLLAWVLSFTAIDPEFEIPFGQYRLNADTLIQVQRRLLILVVVLLAGIMSLYSATVRRLITAAVLKIPRLLRSFGEQWPDRIEKKICRPVVGAMNNFADGLSLIRRPITLILCLGLSVAVWLTNAASFYFVARGCPGIPLTYIEILTMMIIICFFIALPSVPGFWGLWEAGGVFALALFGVASKEAAGYTLFNHAVQIFPIILMGLMSCMIIGVSVRQLKKKTTSEEAEALHGRT
jgi:uncharacterized protein (TIRG00374 family)